ncbi:hypothetical protein OEA41_003250 [Lepraria neglecta]|uniref:UDP-N-acetylglucosamine transferase subunit ALG14 n=1 Tax=Lepraria neglecta TaxID=209136 RepID=A0AAD9Z4B0_9LECA|nr:hypothetical protein OEA41_003250 [Lepraria neglecta]
MSITSILTALNPISPAAKADLPYVYAFLLITLTLAFLRLLYILLAIHRTRPPPRKRGKATHLLIVLGSGGHTAEMLSLLADIDPKSYTHRSYVVSSGDDFSSGKAEEFEDDLAAKATGRGKRFVDDPRKRETRFSRSCIHGYIRRQGYSIHTVPRARRIHQSLLTTPLSSYYCLGTAHHDSCIYYTALLLLLAQLFEVWGCGEDACDLRRILGESEKAEFEWEDYCVVWAL